MEIAPFRIQKRNLDNINVQVRTEPMDGHSSHPTSHTSKTTKVAYYSVESTAPHNIDQRSQLSEGRTCSDESWAQAHRGIRAIAADLHRIKTDPTIAEEPELVIAVHGYNTSSKGVKAWYNDIFKYVANNDPQMKARRNLVFIGYRWPSENILYKPSELASNLRALPNVPRMLLAVGLLLLVTYIGDVVADVLRSLAFVPPNTLTQWLLNQILGELNPYNRLIEAVILLSMKLVTWLALMITMVIISLWLLRISVYFRDVYRAINFGVPDLTELIRQLDQALATLEETQHTSYYAVPIDAAREADDRSDLSVGRVRLSFLGHSMGALVVTNTVRVISDVFDPSSIEQKPTANIGRMLRLSHLVLASPDIPVLSVVSSRANGLASSLRRFDEAYLFSNEGDLALRLASTAANYISFPSAHHYHGHRLGSIAIRNDLYKKGIINLKSLKQHYSLSKPLNRAIQADGLDILKCLFITHQSGKEGTGYLSLKDLYADEHAGKAHATVSDLFTFFDCTDYQDYRVKLTPSGMNEREPKDKMVGLLTRPARKKRKYLSIRDYLDIAWDTRKGLNCHGGYFQGEFTRELMYRLVFLGFEETLKAIAKDTADKLHPETITSNQYEALQQLHERCMAKGIQVYLSPLRYRVDVQGANVREAKAEMLAMVQDASADASLNVSTGNDASTKVGAGVGL
ncbi:MAG: alpha/beta hydrolase [Cyanobacteria bacterium P01_D01_bin.105]